MKCCFKLDTTGSTATSAAAAEHASVNKRRDIINTNGMFNAIFPFQRNSPGFFFPQLFSALSSGKENNPSLVLPSLDQTQLLQSACSSPTHTHTHTWTPRPDGKPEGPLAGPGPFVFDGQRRQTVIGGLARPRTRPSVSYSCQGAVCSCSEGAGFSKSDLFSKGTPTV